VWWIGDVLTVTIVRPVGRGGAITHVELRQPGPGGYRVELALGADYLAAVVDDTAEASTVDGTVMAMPEPLRRIQRERTKGWQLPPNTVIVDRTSRWGNPFAITEGLRDRATALVLYAELVDQLGEPFAAEVRGELGGRNLACWCPPGPCHADLLLRIANPITAAAPVAPSTQEQPMTDQKPEDERPIGERLRELVREQRVDHLADWSRKARFAASLRPDQPWPAWSTGELLAVALILHDERMLTALEYTRREALDRLRYDIGAPSVDAAEAVFVLLRADVLSSIAGPAASHQAPHDASHPTMHGGSVPAGHDPSPEVLHDDDPSRAHGQPTVEGGGRRG
jgi:hypothetical protein